MSLLCNHDTRNEEEAIERHGLDSKNLSGPLVSEIRPGVVSTTETCAIDEANVGLLTKGSVEIFTRVMSSSTSTSPLKDDREVRVGC